jgi:ATP-binding cassette subfamily F protein 3
MVPQLEASIAFTEEAMADFVSAEETQRQAANLEAMRVRHAAALSEWEELSIELEQG